MGAKDFSNGIYDIMARHNNAAFEEVYQFLQKFPDRDYRDAAEVIGNVGLLADDYYDWVESREDFVRDDD